MEEWGAWEAVEGFDLEHLLYEKRWRNRGGGVARIRFDRPERMNAMAFDVMVPFKEKGVTIKVVGCPRMVVRVLFQDL